MIRDLRVAKRVEDIGFYAGFVGSSFMLGRALTSVFWGVIADRYGRKPVIIIGMIVVVIFNTLFGLSSSYFMAIATRFLLGSLNGLLGPIKAYAVELARPEHQATGISLVSTAWGMGLVVGPSIGGLLAQTNFLIYFPKTPYLEETLHMHHQNKPTTVITEGLEGSFHGTEVKIDLEELEGTDAKSNENSNESLLMNWPLMSSIIVYCVFSLHDMAYTESDRTYGGLGFSSQDVGEVLAISGCSLLAFQLFVYPPVEKLLGHVNLCRAAALLAIPLNAAYPFMAKLSRSELTIIVNCASLFKNVLSVIIITGMFILQNNAVSQNQRGAANGIAMTGQSIFKAIAPAAGGAIFSWSQKRRNSSFLPGNHMVFFVLNIVEFVGLIMTFKPFLSYSTQKRR